MVPYAACVLFELYKSKDDFYVQIYYKNTTSDHLPPLNIPGCGTKCTLHEIYHLYRDVIPKYDFETECKLPLASDSVDKPEISWNSGNDFNHFCVQKKVLIYHTFLVHYRSHCSNLLFNYCANLNYLWMAKIKVV